MVIVGAAIVGFFFGSGIGAVVGAAFYSGEGDAFLALTGPANEDTKVPLLVTQAFTSLFSFLIVPLVAWSAYTKKTWKHLTAPLKSAKVWWLLPPLVVCFIVADSWIIQWNLHLDLPDSAFERWAQANEAKLAEVTKLLTSFHSVGYFILCFVVIAVVAGITEEFLFRSLLQNALHRGFQNIHVAIWLSAILFSAFHLQFYGLVPRLLLGAMFGYLYAWSRNVWVPMAAHAFNNGFSLITMYLAQLQYTNTDVENDVAPVPLLLAGALGGAWLLWYLHRHWMSSAATANATTLDRETKIV